MRDERREMRDEGLKGEGEFRPEGGVLDRLSSDALYNFFIKFSGSEGDSGGWNTHVRCS